jgi:hypothetical protein
MDDRLALPAAPTLHQLSAGLHNLRQVWPDGWPGLPLVFDRSWQQLDFPRPRKGSRLEKLLSFGRSVSEHVEADGAMRFRRGDEPAYHNRLHIADTLVCLTFLLKASRHLAVPGADDASRAALALAIMAGHDFLHPGGLNSKPVEFETRAVRDLQPLMAQANLDDRDKEDLEQCILATEPSRVKSFHQAVSQRPFDLKVTGCLAVLVQEADILASTLPQTQENLTQALSKEWSSTQPEAAGKLLLPQNRLLFLEHAALFSSPASLLLGLNKVKVKQMKAIQSRLAMAP